MGKSSKGGNSGGSSRGSSGGSRGSSSGGRGQGNAGGWPSTTGNPSGGGRSNNSKAPFDILICATGLAERVLDLYNAG